jgi:hypothetical protein
MRRSWQFGGQGGSIPARSVRRMSGAGGMVIRNGIEGKDPALINNRQAGRRNRGRNNGRPNGGGNRGGDNGNRIDNRARGNAPQLLEKYRNMARDAQLAGDRVSTEYYLQFADHYFRVIADNRARQEEQQGQQGQGQAPGQQRFRRNDEPFDDFGDEGSFDDQGNYNAAPDDGEYPRNEQQQARPQDRNRERYAGRENGREYPREREGNRDQDGRREPSQRDQGQRDQGQRDQGQREYVQRERVSRDQRPRREETPVVEPMNEQAAPAAVEETSAAAPVRRRGRPPRVAKQETPVESAGLDLAVLPPAIARASEAPEPTEAAPAPRKRGRPRKATAEAAE